MSNGKHTRITMKDVALKSGFAINTISRAMRDDKRLSEETRNKIKQVAHKLGYIPNQMASTLRSGKSHIIAVIINDLHNQHFTILLEALDKSLREHGYNMMIFCMQLNETLGEQLIHTAISQNAEGILYFPFHNNSTHIEIMQKNHVPFVLIDRWIQGIQVDCVRIDDIQAGYVAGRHLIELGHRTFLHLAGILSSSSEIERMEGFMKALQEAGLPEKCTRILSWETIQEAIANDTLEKRLLPLDYTAIFSFSDELAYHGINALEKLDLAIPEDVSIISIDHIRGGIHYLPHLTSIAAMDETIAKSAVSILVNRMNRPEMPMKTDIHTVKIFDEGTTAPPRTNG